jgi:hypothetical protein
MQTAKAGIGVATNGMTHSERFIGRVVAACAAGWFMLWLIVRFFAGSDGAGPGAV